MKLRNGLEKQTRTVSFCRSRRRRYFVLVASYSKKRCKFMCFKCILQVVPEEEYEFFKETMDNDAGVNVGEHERLVCYFEDGSL